MSDLFKIPLFLARDASDQPVLLGQSGLSPTEGSMGRSAWWAVVAAALLVIVSPDASAKRVALLIGNAAYAGKERLENPVRDAELLARTLQQGNIKFDSVRVVPNAKRADMYLALSQFKKEAAGADVALLYYSGHGMVNSSKVNHALHTPLMSITNAISGIIVVGAMLQLAVDDPITRTLSVVAVLLASINIFGGFAVTRRMLRMFSKGNS